MKLAGDDRVRLHAAAEIRRRLGDRPATISVDGVQMDDAVVRQHIESENKAAETAEQARYESTLKSMHNRSSPVGTLRRTLADLRTGAVRQAQALQGGQDTFEKLANGLRVKGVEVGKHALNLLKSEGSYVRHLARVEVRLPDQSVGHFDVDVSDVAAGRFLRPIVVGAAALAACPLLPPGTNVASLTPVAIVVGLASLAPAAVGDKSLRDAMLRTAAKVFGLGLAGEVDSSRLSSWIAVSGELSRAGKPAASIVDVNALEKFLGSPAPVSAPQVTLDEPPPTVKADPAQAADPLGWGVHEAPVGLGAPLADVNNLGRPAAKPAGSPQLLQRKLEKTVAERKAIEANIATATEHHAETFIGQEAMRWAFRAMATHPKARSLLNFTEGRLDQRLAEAETSWLARLPLGFGDRVSHRVGHLSDAEVQKLLGADGDLDAFALGKRDEVLANLQARGIRVGDGPRAERAYALFLAGADLAGPSSAAR